MSEGWTPPQDPQPQQPPPGPPPGPPGAYPGYQYQPHATYYAPPTTEGTAVGALVASILAFVFCPVIPAIVALVLASTADRKIRESGGRLTGEGLAKAGRIIAIVHLALAAVGFAFFVLLIAIGAMDSTTTVS